MVQYVFTPWRDRRELLLVRQQFYGALSPTPAMIEAEQSSGSSRSSGGGDRLGVESAGENSVTAKTKVETGTGTGTGTGAGTHPSQGDGHRNDQHHAVARVSMWMQRGNCPHMVESTALLMAAVLSDEASSSSSSSSSSATAATEMVAGSSTYAVRAAYSAAFSRFVTGLLDGHQDKLRKQSMYSIAKTIGLPATFVELRHQATHEQLPSLARLRSAAKKALLWIWGYYWKHLGDDADADADPAGAEVDEAERHRYKELVMSYLREDDEDEAAKLMPRLKQQQDLGGVLRTVTELQTMLPGNKAFLKCLRLSRELMTAATSQTLCDDGSALTMQDTPVTDQDDEGEAEASATDEKLDHDLMRDSCEETATGWSLCGKGWKAKPIGHV